MLRFPVARTGHKQNTTKQHALLIFINQMQMVYPKTQYTDLNCAASFLNFVRPYGTPIHVI